MNDEPDNEREERPTTEEQLERSGLTRRGFLDHLKILGIGAGAALMLGTRHGDAKVTPSQPAELAADGKEDATEGDSDDPVERAQYFRRRRRRYWRRRRRRYWRRRYWWRRRRVYYW
jgi:hypothetical protein